MAFELQDEATALCKKHLIPHRYIPTSFSQTMLLKLLYLENHHKGINPSKTATLPRDLNELYLIALRDPGSKIFIDYLQKRLEVVEHLRMIWEQQNPVVSEEKPLTATEQDRVLDYVETPKKRHWFRQWIYDYCWPCQPPAFLR